MSLHDEEKEICDIITAILPDHKPVFKHITDRVDSFRWDLGSDGSETVELTTTIASDRPHTVVALASRIDVGIWAGIHRFDVNQGYHDELRTKVAEAIVAFDKEQQDEIDRKAKAKRVVGLTTVKKVFSNILVHTIDAALPDNNSRKITIPEQP